MTTWYFLFYLFTGEVVKIDRFVSWEQCETYRAKVVVREGSKTGTCQTREVSSSTKGSL